MEVPSKGYPSWGILSLHGNKVGRFCTGSNAGEQAAAPKAAKSAVIAPGSEDFPGVAMVVKLSER